MVLVPEVGIEPSWAQGPGDFECVGRGWRKSLEILQTLRQPPNFTKEIDNDGVFLSVMESMTEFDR